VAAYDLCKALHRVVADRAAAMAARAGEFAALADLDLYRQGAHPLLLFHFATVMGSRERYVREVVPRLRGVPNAFYDYYARDGDGYGR
jgi:hypothetical protein